MAYKGHIHYFHKNNLCNCLLEFSRFDILFLLDFLPCCIHFADVAAVTPINISNVKNSKN